MNFVVIFDDGRAPMRCFRLTKDRYLAKLIGLEKEYILEQDGFRQGIYYWKATKKPN